jgi:hypothetical protein
MERYVAGQRARGCSHGDRTGERSVGHRGFKVRIGDYIEGRGDPIEGDAGGSGKALSEDANIFADRARGRAKGAAPMSRLKTVPLLYLPPPRVTPYKRPFVC